MRVEYSIAISAICKVFLQEKRGNLQLAIANLQVSILIYGLSEDYK